MHRAERELLLESVASPNKAANSLSLNELFDNKGKQHVGHHNLVGFLGTEDTLKFTVNVTTALK